jgi:hypothetical protein
MKLISTLVASVTMLAATSFVPAGALTPAKLDTTQLSPVESVAWVCRERCRAGVCRERCEWVPNRPRVRIEQDGYRAYGRDRRNDGPGIEFRIR